MKKYSKNGFVLAETLVVTVFLMIIFSMIYSSFYPLLGEYEKREAYDDIDSKYAVYWIKKIIEDGSYKIENDDPKRADFNNNEYLRFECEDVSTEEEKKQTCISLVKSLEVRGCDLNGNGCDIFLTKYRIGDESATTDFKRIVKTNKDNTLIRYREDCNSTDSDCRKNFIENCKKTESGSDAIKENKCSKKADKKVFDGAFQNYIESIPDYKTESLNQAKYRVIVVFQHKRDNNNYYSYSTIEVLK